MQLPRINAINKVVHKTLHKSHLANGKEIIICEIYNDYDLYNVQEEVKNNYIHDIDWNIDKREPHIRYQESAGLF